MMFRAAASCSEPRRLAALGLVVALAGCAAPPPAPLPVAAAPHVAAPAPASQPSQQSTPVPTLNPNTSPGPGIPPSASLDENGHPILFNDPPASPDTPLCGREARERNAIGAQIQAARVASSGVCSSFACYDPLTATYIGADGYTHVCR
ncbi:hypothetical protein [Lichenicoccus roseus]|uniref:Lectin-like protein BA14k n=1 Tax=Lichenicoccus roseus TaxID=2683649 RepID=A0A5R9J9J5_9PROT|nr:hypothetical protein [Lichenicoccus roseus]TLU74270.1 hypothetical protein FE263_03495 [Lichenicoccus roseus]